MGRHFLWRLGVETNKKKDVDARKVYVYMYSYIKRLGTVGMNDKCLGRMVELDRGEEYASC